MWPMTTKSRYPAITPNRQALRALRISKGISLTGLARTIGYDKGNLHRIESGLQKRLGSDYARAIARELDVPLAAIVTSDEVAR